MPCLAHTLQLTLKAVMKHPNADSLISRARKLVHTVRKSSVANEAMIKKCGKTLVRDCSTHWNSTFDMLRRLLEIRTELNQVLEELGMDTLLTSNWAKLENLVKLLEPFAIHTDQLQSDSQSLSQVVPCLLNLEAHLLTTASGKQLAQVLLKSLRERFAAILSPDSPQFDATPAAACLLDPSVSLILQTPDMVPLRRAAQSLVQNLAAQYNTATPSQDNVIATQTAAHSPPTVLQKYRFLASRMEVNASLTNEPEGADSLLTEMKKYGDDVKQGVFNETPLQFWRSREAVYPKLAPVALDLVSAPASQAFVERIFSVCGLLSSGLRNRTTTSLEQRVFLKINKKLLFD
ncbi:E3 SUMO-protein ligase ZBED1-like [Epinephelus lanceolatus]